jgi:hypothetical protein
LFFGEPAFGAVGIHDADSMLVAECFLLGRSSLAFFIQFFGFFLLCFFYFFGVILLFLSLG